RVDEDQRTALGFRDDARRIGIRRGIELRAFLARTSATAAATATRPARVGALEDGLLDLGRSDRDLGQVVVLARDRSDRDRSGSPRANRRLADAALLAPAAAAVAAATALLVFEAVAEIGVGRIAV